MKRPLSLPAGATVLLLIDLQEEHRQDERFLVENYQAVLENAAMLLDTARRNGVTVMHAAYERDFNKVPPRPLEPRTNQGAAFFSLLDDPKSVICSEVAPIGDEYVVRKNDASCFCEIDFTQMLERRQPEWLLVAGVWTEACVAATVRDATTAGYRVALVKDACGSGTGAMHQTALIHIANRLYGGAVVSTDDALALLRDETREVWQLEGSTTLRFTAETIGDVYRSL